MAVPLKSSPRRFLLCALATLVQPGWLAGSYRHAADAVGVFDLVYLLNLIVLFMLTVVGPASTLALYLGEC